MDWMFLLQCVLDATVGFLAWIAFVEPASGALILPIAIGVLAGMQFFEGLFTGAPTDRGEWSG